jgi:hypothetical protein
LRCVLAAKPFFKAQRDEGWQVIAKSNDCVFLFTAIPSTTTSSRIAIVVAIIGVAIRVRIAFV